MSFLRLLKYSKDQVEDQIEDQVNSIPDSESSNSGLQIAYSLVILFLNIAEFIEFDEFVWGVLVFLNFCKILVNVRLCGV